MRLTVVGCMYYLVRFEVFSCSCAYPRNVPLCYVCVLLAAVSKSASPFRIVEHVASVGGVGAATAAANSAAGPVVVAARVTSSSLSFPLSACMGAFSEVSLSNADTILAPVAGLPPSLVSVTRVFVGGEVLWLVLECAMPCVDCFTVLDLCVLLLFLTCSVSQERAQD